MNNKWLDRVKNKKHLEKWLESTNNYYVLNVTDPLETEDLIDWLKLNSNSFEKSISYISSNDDTPAIKFMDDVCLNIGHKNFKKFDKIKKETYATKVNLTINQEMGKNISSKEVSITENTQKVEVSDKFTPLFQLESQKSTIARSFINDISKYQHKKKLLLICRLDFEEGLDFETSFLFWLKNDFLKNLKLICNTKVFIVTNGNLDTVKSEINYDNQSSIHNLNLDDIIGVTRHEITQYETFCKTILNIENNDIDYRTFKYKLERHKSEQ